ncbi:hypothetical protein V8B55DRAFT_1507229 [Mucor lusitanicus]|uniref:Uncharacterized protein n=2 Tax=Mucor circinelloides f. lusitanicus TaxID=29924 RepID=A0A168Q0N1_MUCCL|nr:hypothetical protein FB192DRAFT_1445494 [Mucor lusitanicus]OAD08514.1 hypothetical protein MUCCIDRAFT_158722 [Mucor lusitanicus CBS 277.49]
MTFDTTTPPKPKLKRSRKLPRRAILDADFVVPSSHRAIDDLLMERAPSQHDRVILSELWGGNDPHFQESIMPAVSIGKPKRSLHGDALAKPKTYKDMLREKHKDDWAMDLSNVTFVPPTAKGKHIRSSSESTPPVTEASDESASEPGTDNLAPLDESDVAVDQLKCQKPDGVDKENIDCLGVGSQNKVDESNTPIRVDSTDVVDSDKMESALDKINSIDNTTDTLPSIQTGKAKEAIHHGKEPNSQTKASPNPSSNYCDADDRGGDVNEASINATADEPTMNEAEALHDEHMEEEDNDYMPSYSDDECVVDQDIAEKLRQMPVIADQNKGESNDFSTSEIAPTTTDNTTSKEEIPQEPPSAETNPSISSSTDCIHEQRLAPEACVSGDNNAGDGQDQQEPTQTPLDSTAGSSQSSTLSAKDQQQQLNIPLDDTTLPSNDDNSKPERRSDEDQELMETRQDQDEQPLEIAAPVSRQMLVSGTQNSAMISDKVSQIQAKKPLLNLDQPVYLDTDSKIRSNPKIIKKWQPNQKHHPLLNALKSTTALHWIEDGHDDMRKKDIGLARKRQLEARFSKPFVTKKRFRNCWFVETSNHKRC